MMTQALHETQFEWITGRCPLKILRVWGQIQTLLDPFDRKTNHSKKCLILYCLKNGMKKKCYMTHNLNMVMGVKGKFRSCHTLFDREKNQSKNCQIFYCLQNRMMTKVLHDTRLEWLTRWCHLEMGFILGSSAK